MGSFSVYVGMFAFREFMSPAHASGGRWKSAISFVSSSTCRWVSAAAFALSSSARRIY
jgi:hypothetical protein